MRLRLLNVGSKGLVVEAPIDDRKKIRDPKSEIRKKSEIRSPNPDYGMCMDVLRSSKWVENLSVSSNAVRAIRISGLGLLSEFGSRISGFATAAH